MDKARRDLSQRASRSATDRKISPGDVVDRYRGRRDAGERAGSTRGANGHASKLPMLSDKRRDSNSQRVKALRDSADRRARDARKGAVTDAGRRADARRRATNGRPLTKASDAKDLAGARDSYMRRLNSAVGLPNSGNRANNANRSGITHVGAPGAHGVGGLGNVWRGGHNNFGVRNDWYYNQCYWNTWGNQCWSPFSSWFCAPFYSTGYWWNSYWCLGGGWGFGFQQPWRTRYRFPRNSFYYGPFLPASQTYVIYEEVEPETVYVEAPAEDAAVADAIADPIAGVPVGEPAGGQPGFGQGGMPAQLAPEATEPGLQRELNRAAAYYLTLGDRAFRETRYGDAVHFYGKAVEFAPDSGILYLVLSDALFATGDYRYAAYALRQSFANDPTLASNVIDKREFYANPAEFDEQLATLERFVEDHVLDMDARLVLSANYLFGGQPEAAAALLENPFSEELTATDEGRLLLTVSRQVVAGEVPAPSESPSSSKEF